MELKEFISKKVAEYYWKDDINCAATTLKILSEIFKTPLNNQIISSVLAMPGAGQCGALCGLVSGSIMFMGIWGNENKISESDVKDYCKNFTQEFENNFKSLRCSILRPEGFHPDNPPHICEKITCRAIEFSADMLFSFIDSQKQGYFPGK